MAIISIVSTTCDSNRLYKVNNNLILFNKMQNEANRLENMNYVVLYLFSTRSYVASHGNSSKSTDEPIYKRKQSLSNEKFINKFRFNMRSKSQN